MSRASSSFKESKRVYAAGRIAALLLVSFAPAAFAQQARQPGDSESPLNPDEIFQQMSRITGLPIKGSLKKERVSKAEVEKYLRENLAAEYTPAQMHGQEAALKAFGVVGPDFNLQSFLVSLYTEQAAGYYDPRRKTMFMADWVEPDQQKMVLAHELTHALQDQNFDLWKFMHATSEDDDATAARQALVEGYATLAMIQAMLGSIPIEKVPSLDAMMDQVVNQQMTEYPIFSKAPFFLRFQVLFPYAQGMHFVHEGLIEAGWKRLNEVFLNPPATTKEIFQPDLYFKPPDNSSRPPAALELPPPAVLEHESSLKLVESNSMGELGYYALLGQLLSQDEAAKIGKSWMADRYLVYEGPTPGQFMLIARSRWKNEQAATDFCGDYRKIIEDRWPEARRGDSSPERTVGSAASNVQERISFTSGTRRTFLLRKGEECRWAQGVPAAQADEMAKGLEALP
jgi:hypothetical protein